jgi:hypothetical protein
VFLYIQVGKAQKILHVGESVIVPAGTPHRFYNKTSDKVKFHITLKPGHTGMENFIKIFYGLASDGLTDQKREAKNFAHLAVCINNIRIQMRQGGCHYFRLLFGGS